MKFEIYGEKHWPHGERDNVAYNGGLKV